jgi:hypothetical protein
LLDSFYASPDLVIDGHNAIDVLAAAHYFGCAPSVQSACVAYLSQVSRGRGGLHAGFGRCGSFPDASSSGPSLRQPALASLLHA